MLGRLLNFHCKFPTTKTRRHACIWFFIIALHNYFSDYYFIYLQLPIRDLNRGGSVVVVVVVVLE